MSKLLNFAEGQARQDMKGDSTLYEEECACRAIHLEAEALRDKASIEAKAARDAFVHAGKAKVHAINTARRAYETFVAAKSKNEHARKAQQDLLSKYYRLYSKELVAVS